MPLKTVTSGPCWLNHSGLNKISCMSICVLSARLVRLLLFQGCSPNAAVVKAGWNNKRTCMQRRMERVRGLTESPVYISVSGKYGFTWKHPQGCAELDKLDDFFHHHSMGMRFRAMSSLPGPVTPQIKRHKAPENRISPNYSRKRLKTWDGEPLLRPGSLEWYEDQLRKSSGCSCAALVQTRACTRRSFNILGMCGLQSIR